jgi:predicted nucleic acid-binding Zn finger protein
MNTTTATLTPSAISQALGMRRERASREANQYGLFRQANGVYSVVSRDGKRTYEATETACTCADFRHRGAAIGACKHVFQVRTAEEERREVAEAKAADRARYEARLAEDFPAD